VRIAFDTRWIRTSNQEGVGGYALELLLKMLETDRENSYLAFIETEEKFRYFQKRFRPERFKNLEVRREHLVLSSIWANNVSLPLFLRRNDIDIYHVPFFAFTPFKAGYKIIATVYDLIPYLYPRYSVRDCPVVRFFFRHKAFARFMMNKADKFVVSSKGSIEYLKREMRMSDDKLKLIYPGVGEEFRRVADRDALRIVSGKYGIPEGSIVFMGELGLHKNISGLIEAYLSLGEKLRKKHKLVIIGRGEKLYPKDVDRSVASGSPHRDIIMPGYILLEDKPAIYSLASCFVSPTRYEGFPHYILEAMACGTPVAASDINEIREFAGKGSYAGFDPDDPSSIGAALESVLTDEKHRKDMIAIGKKAASRFTWDKAAREILALYNNVKG